MWTALFFVIVNATFSHYEQNMGNSVNINVAGIFYEIVNATYIVIIEIVNETFMNFGILKTQINTGFIRRYTGGTLLIRVNYSQNPSFTKCSINAIKRFLL